MIKEALSHLCDRCWAVSQRHIEYLVERRMRNKDIRTWCRKCGEAALIKIGQLRYRDVVDKFKIFDGVRMEHEAGYHVEMGGWGTLFRLDDVLRLAFPKEYAMDPAAPYWPVDSNYPYKSKLSQGIEFVSDNECTSEELTAREQRYYDINRSPSEREDLAERYGKVWGQLELEEEFEVIGFKNPYAVVQRKNANEVGTVQYQDSPRYYFLYKPDTLDV